MRKFLSILFVAFLSGYSTMAMSATVSCKFDSWRGADTNEIAISWVGLGFVADTNKAIVEIRFSDGSSTEKVKVVRTDRFVGFVFYKDEEASDGTKHKNRYSYRLYNTGKCEGRVDEEGYQPVFATGRTN
jgi:uncharacterized protein (DUF1684 family)